MFRATRSLMIGFAALFLFFDFAAAADLDPWLRSLAEPPIAAAPGRSPVTIAYEHVLGLERDPRSGETRVGTLLVLDGALPDLSDVPGLRIGSIVGNIATAYLPLESLDPLSRVEGIRHVMASRLQYPLLDQAIPDAKVSQVWNGSPAYTGDGVLVGIIDSGIDWTHDDFRNSNGTTRIKAIWDVFGTGTPPSGFTKGVEYTESAINNALNAIGTVGEVDLNGHGTHVSGIAAGNGRASGGLYTGVAFEADILFAKPFSDQNGGFPEAETIDAMSYLVQKAQSLGQPLVVNMSLGGHSGPHDGTTAQESVVNQLSGTGKVFAIAAGNEGEDFLHDSGPASGTTLTLTVPQYTPNGGINNDFVLISLWVEGGSSPSVTVSGPLGGTSGAVASGQQFGQDTPSGVIIVDNATQGPNPLNGDKEIFIELDDQAGTNIAAGNWTITVSGGTGMAHAWAFFSSMGAGFPNSNQAYSLGMPAGAESAVSVAAYKTRNNWPSKVGTVGYNAGSSLGAAAIGARAPFSSLGPTRDERQKPDVAAPGAAIVSTLSRDNTPPLPNELVIAGDKYYATQGTSMATPLTAGVIALMLERNGSLSAAEIRSILRNTARTDGFTGATWNNGFGMGKVDAVAAVAAAGSGGTPEADGDIDNDGSATVLDVVLLVNHILDAVGHPLTTEQRTAADVFPSPGGDGNLNVQDLARIVAFILKTDVPGSPLPGVPPASLEVGEPRIAGSGWELPVTISGSALAAGQFAVSVSGAGWNADAIRVQGSSAVTVRAGQALDQVRVLIYGVGASLPEEGITLWIPFSSEDDRPRAELAGVVLTDRFGFAREVQVGTVHESRPPLRFLQASPNPLVTATSLSFQLTVPARVTLRVHDLQGREVAGLVDATLDPGLHDVPWDGRDGSGRRLPAGMYFARLLAGDQALTHKLVIGQ